MKKLALILFLTFKSIAYGQIESPRVKYESDRLEHPTIKDSTQLFNNKMLNIIFADKVGTAFGGTNDLSLQKFFASLDAGENSISLGGNFQNRKTELEPLIWVYTGGLKMKAKDKFTTFYKNGDFQENSVGAFFKLTYIKRGTINFNNLNYNKKTIHRSKAIQAYRNHLYTDYEKKAVQLNREEADAIKNKLADLRKNSSEAPQDSTVFNKKSEELYIAMAKEEIKYIEDNTLYKSLKTWYFSADIYFPFGMTEYKTTNDITTSLSNKGIYSFSTSITANHMRIYSSGKSFFLKIRGTLKNLDNITVDGLTTTPFQTSAIGANNVSVITNVDDGYITNFEKFLTASLAIEPAMFFLNSSVGISPAIEFNAGKYCKTNWKLGIPVSLKDKEGKPKVNFELQWKEVNTFTSSDHIVGVSVNFLFGEMIN